MMHIRLIAMIDGSTYENVYFNGSINELNGCLEEDMFLPVEYEGEDGDEYDTYLNCGNIISLSAPRHVKHKNAIKREKEKLELKEDDGLAKLFDLDSFRNAVKEADTTEEKMDDVKKAAPKYTFNIFDHLGDISSQLNKILDDKEAYNELLGKAMLNNEIDKTMEKKDSDTDQKKGITYSKYCAFDNGYYLCLNRNGLNRFMELLNKDSAFRNAKITLTDVYPYLSRFDEECILELFEAYHEDGILDTRKPFPYDQIVELVFDYLVDYLAACYLEDFEFPENEVEMDEPYYFMYRSILEDRTNLLKDCKEAEVE